MTLCPPLPLRGAQQPPRPTLAPEAAAAAAAVAAASAADTRPGEAGRSW
jgi:hypothetical protein